MEATPEDVYVQRLGADGAVLYESGGFAIGTEAGSRSSLSIRAQNGHVVATWMDLLEHGADVYAAMRRLVEN